MSRKSWIYSLIFFQIWMFIQSRLVSPNDSTIVLMIITNIVFASLALFSKDA